LIPFQEFFNLSFATCHQLRAIQIPSLKDLYVKGVPLLKDPEMRAKSPCRRCHPQFMGP
jgi:hypothetical protein